MFKDINFINENIMPECVICLENFTHSEHGLWTCRQCKVKIHNTCVDQLIIKECPHCRKEFITETHTTLTINPAYNSINIGRRDFYIYNEVFRVLLYKCSVAIIVCFATILTTIGCVFFLLPTLIHSEEVYNMTTIK